MNMLFDSHVHLNDDPLYPKAKDLIRRAMERGVTKFNVVGYDPEMNRRAIQLAEQFDNVYATIGFHPTSISTITESDWRQLEVFLTHPKVVAVGECGLDYYWDKATELIQKEAFIRQIKLAEKVGKPLVIHMREAAKDTLDILKEHKKKSVGGIMHCYSGSVEMVDDFVKLNLHISLAGPVTFKNARVPKDVARVVPEHRLLIETDSPWLAPAPYRGKENEPMLLHHIASEIASLRGITYEAISEITYENTCKLFKIEI
jgi:TatD DNase family protein